MSTNGLQDQSIPLPPSRIRPAAFYLDYLTPAWTALNEDLCWPGSSLEVSFVLRGDQDEHDVYTVRVAGTQLSATREKGSQPLLTIHCDLPAWRVAVRDVWCRALRRVWSHRTAVRTWLRGYLANLDPESLPQALQRHPGTLLVHYQGDTGETCCYEIRIGHGQGPTAEIWTQDADLWTLLSGDITLGGLVRSRLRLGGDVGYPLRLLGALETLVLGRRSCHG